MASKTGKSRSIAVSDIFSTKEKFVQASFFFYGDVWKIKFVKRKEVNNYKVCIICFFTFSVNFNCRIFI